MVHNLSKDNSIVNQFVAELRDIEIQKDRMRFRKNLVRLGEIFAYEISRKMHYTPSEVTTPLGIATVPVRTEQPIVGTILRAGMPLHEGLLNFFDHADNAFISAYRKHHKDGSFDIVYSWGVLHHSPDTPRAIGEVWRVLRPKGTAKVMIYHTWSVIGFMLWCRYGLLAGRPLISLRELYDRYLESPGTKAYSTAEARQLFRAFTDVRIETVLTHGDLLESEAGQRHQGLLLNIARAIWPRWLIRRLFPNAGLFMLITARK